jgi:L-galactose dehydrogenase
VIPRAAVDADDPLGFLLEKGAAATIPEAAYRFCRHEPAVDVVLTGTGNPEHLKANIQAILKPPLPQPALERLEKVFGELDSLTAN